MLMRVKTKNVYEQNGVTYAIIPSAELKVSASASLMMREAKTFWPAEQRPRISISVEFFTCITKALSMYSRHLVNGKVPSLTDFYLYGNRMASIDIYGHRPFDYQTKSLVTEWSMPIDVYRPFGYRTFSLVTEWHSAIGQVKAIWLPDTSVNRMPTVLIEVNNERT